MDDLIERILMIIGDIFVISLSLLAIYLGISIWWVSTVLLVKLLISGLCILGGITFIFMMIYLTIRGW